MNNNTNKKKQFPLFKCSCSAQIGWFVFHYCPIKVGPLPKEAADNQSRGCSCLMSQRRTTLTCQQKMKQKRKKGKKNVAPHFSADLILADDCRSETLSGLCVRTVKKKKKDFQVKNAADELQPNDFTPPAASRTWIQAPSAGVLPAHFAKYKVAGLMIPESARRARNKLFWRPESKSVPTPACRAYRANEFSIPTLNALCD